MKIVIDIPEEVKDAFDNASNEDINFSYYDYNSVIGKAIRNGTPLDDITTKIKKIIKLYEGTCDQELGIKWGFEEALEIIDNHIGKENNGNA